MPYYRRTLTVTTAADGSATAYLPGPDDAQAPIQGEVRALIYSKVDFTDGVAFSLSGADTGTVVWAESAVNVSKTVNPTVPAYDQAGAPRLFSAGGEAVPAGPPVLAGERLKIVITGGGNVTTGIFTAIFG